MVIIEEIVTAITHLRMLALCHHGNSRTHIDSKMSRVINMDIDCNKVGRLHLLWRMSGWNNNPCLNVHLV